MEPTTKEDFTPAELLACVGREVAMRRACYPKWDKVESVDQLKPGRKKELAMMEAVGAELSAIREERDRAVAGLFVLRKEVGLGSRVTVSTFDRVIEAVKVERSQPNA